MDLTNKKVFGDTDCLSSFLFLDEFTLLESLLDGIVIPDAVYQELTANGTPAQIVNNLELLMEKKFIKVQDIDLRSSEHQWYDEIRAEYHMNKGFPIGEGEAQAMALAIPNGGILASNNLSDVDYFVNKYHLPLLTSAFIIGVSVDKDYLSYDEAELTWKKMENNRIRMPGSFESYYEGQYLKDLKEYGKRVSI